MRAPKASTEPRDRGFSLVEILIVIVVLGILATVTVFAVRGVADRGEGATCGEDQRILQTAAQAYFAQFSAAAIPTSDPAVAGTTGTTPEATLVEVGLLAAASELHDVGADGEVSVAAGSGC